MLDRNNPRDRMEKLKRRTQGAELFFSRKLQIHGFGGSSHMIPSGRANLSSLTPRLKSLEDILPD